MESHEQGKRKQTLSIYEQSETKTWPQVIATFCEILELASRSVIAPSEQHKESLLDNICNLNNIGSKCIVVDCITKDADSCIIQHQNQTGRTPSASGPRVSTYVKRCFMLAQLTQKSVFL